MAEEFIYSLSDFTVTLCNGREHSYLASNDGSGFDVHGQTSLAIVQTEMVRIDVLTNGEHCVMVVANGEVKKHCRPLSGLAEVEVSY